MKILLVTSFFPPEIGSAAHLFLELAQGLRARGNEVTVVTNFPRTWKTSTTPRSYGRSLVAREEMEGIPVIRVRSTTTPKDSLFAAGLEHFTAPLSLFVGGLMARKHDAILIFSPPLPLGLTTFLLSKIWRVPLVVNIQDLYPQAVIDLQLLRNPLLIWVFRIIEKLVYRLATHLTVHSEGNRQYVVSKGAKPDKVTVVYNWADLDNIQPAPKDNAFREEHDLDNAFLVSYAGIISYSQDLDTVIRSASLLRGEKNVRFVLVGDGVQKEQLVAQASEMGLENVLFLPFVPKPEYAQILCASDVCLVTLKKGKVSTPVVPGKLHSIMASGRPVLASVPLDGDTPRIVEAARCGISVEPGNPEAMARAIMSLSKNPTLAEQYGRCGREYAEKHFSLSTATDSYLALFERLRTGHVREEEHDRSD